MSTMNRLIIAEINTWVWLAELEAKSGCSLTLDSIPDEEWDRLIALGFNAIWLMGVWKRSPIGRRISQANVDLYGEYSRSLPGWKMEDLPGSPYCVKEYSVDPRLGGTEAIKKLKDKLNNLGIKLILDFVPNHTAQDHKWVSTHPEYYVHGTESDYLQYPRDFFEASGGIICKGRDPFFPPWQDVAQLNAYSIPYRKASAELLKKIGTLCDGVRCDMAMLLINHVFSYTWQNRAGTPPDTEYWHDIIQDVHEKYPDFLFIAEAYWDLEWDLMQLGFNYCYDKRLYDRMTRETAETVRQHLKADTSFQSRLVRFLENHDEPRAAGLLPVDRLKAATLITATLPGALLMYEGQWDGRKTRNHVLLGRRQQEMPNVEIRNYFQILMEAIKDISPDSTWEMCDVSGWPDNQSCHNLIVYCWQTRGRVLLIVVNYSETPAQGKINLPWAVDKTRPAEFFDLFEHAVLLRDGSKLAEEGLFVELPAWGYHFLSIEV